MNATFAADPLLPRDPGGRGAGALLALAAHVALVAALALSVRWRAQTPEPVVAELWAAVPQAVPVPVPAPAPPPLPAPSPPPPAPPVRAPAPPLPAPPVMRDPDIATERAARAQREREDAERQQRAAAEARRAAEQRAQAERAAQARAEAERQQAAAQREQAERREAERQRVAEQRRRDEQARAAEQARLAEQKKRDDAERKAQAEARAKADEDRVARQREDTLRRMQASAAQDAGGSGGGAPGGAAQAAPGGGGPPSADYGARLVAAIRPNIVFTGAVSSVATAEVEVRTAAGGSVLSRRIVKTSGNREWDDAVLRAIDRTAVLPRDHDGRVPGTLVLVFRPRD